MLCHQIYSHCQHSFRLSLKKLVQRNATIKRAIEDRFNGWSEDMPSLVNKHEFNNFRDGIALLFDRLNYNPQDELDDSTMDRMYVIKPDPVPFIQSVDCARNWADSIECGNLTRIDSIRSRTCSTILHRGSMLYDVVNHPELFNNTHNHLDAHSYFDAKEVIKMVINFEPEDYADLKRQIGARIIFHDNNFVAGSGNLDFFITRGFRYDFNIDRKDTRLLDKPYGECLDYDKFNLHKYRDRIEPRVPLSGNTCFQNCVVRNIIHRSNCWAPTMPYYRNDSLDPEKKYKPCNWYKGSHHVSIFDELLRVEEYKRNLHRKLTGQGARSNHSSRRLFDEHMKIYRRARRFCWSQCALGCKITEYSVTFTRSAWPSDVKILFDKTGKELIKRHCCALLAIKFTHFHYNVHEFMPKYNLANVVGDLGGLLAFWLGLSIVSLYQGIQKLIEFFGRRRSATAVAATPSNLTRTISRRRAASKYNQP